MLARQRSREWFMRTNLRVSEQRGDTHTGSNHPHRKETRDNAKRGRHRRPGAPQRHRAASSQPESGPARSDFHGPEAGQPRRSERVHRESSVPEPAPTAERDCAVLPNLRRMSVVMRLSSSSVLPSRSGFSPLAAPAACASSESARPVSRSPCLAVLWWHLTPQRQVSCCAQPDIASDAVLTQAMNFCNSLSVDQASPCHCDCSSQACP
jgi:hypothetical protein